MQKAEVDEKNQISSAKGCALIATFVSILIVAQLALSFVPGVEVISVLFITFSFVLGAKSGMISATIFSLVRQLVFGFYPVVLVLYLLYFNLLTFCFGLLGKKAINELKTFPIVIGLSCVFTIMFTMFDNILTPLWYGYSLEMTKLYFIASIPFMIPQVISVLVSVSILFFPLKKVLNLVKNKL